MKTTETIDCFRAALEEFIYDKKVISQVDLAKKVDKEAKYINDIVKGRRNPSSQLQDNIVSVLGVRHEDFIARGRQILEQGGGKPPTIHSQYLEAPRLVSIPLLNSEVSAGHHFTGVEGVRTMVQMPEDILGRKTSDGLGMITVAGDSMEPTLKSGDKVIFDSYLSALDSGGMFVIAVGERLAVKRLQTMYNGKVMIKSDNPAYSAEIAPADQVYVKGKVIWYARALG